MTGELGDHPMLEMTKVAKTYRIGGQTVRALDDITLTLTGRRVRFGRRSFGCGQEHPAAPARRAGPTGLRIDPIRGRRDRRPQRRSAVRIPEAQSRIRLPVLQPAADDDGMGERRGAEGARRRTDGEGQDPRLGTAGTGRASVTAPSTGRRSCPAARCSESPWPGR